MRDWLSRPWGCFLRRLGLRFDRPVGFAKELLGRLEMRALVDEQLAKIKPEEIERGVKIKLGDIIAETCGHFVQLYLKDQARARLDDAIRAIDFKPRVEAAARKTLEDALRRINFCGVALEPYLLGEFRRLLQEKVDAHDFSESDVE